MIIAVMVVLFNIFLLIFPREVLTASRDGLMLWFNNVLPSLLPFMVAANMLILLGFSRFLGRLAAPLTRFAFGLPGEAGFGLVTGLTSGYPIGAKTVADLNRSGRLSTRDAQHLLAFCNNAGPLFILGVVGVGMFGSAGIGYVLWATHVAGALLVGVLLRRKNLAPRGQRLEVRGQRRAQFPVIAGLTRSHISRGIAEPAPYLIRGQARNDWKPRFSLPSALCLLPSENEGRNNWQVLGEAVKNAMEAITLVGGLIIFFNVVVAVLEQLGLPKSPILGGIPAGLIEVTGGVRRIAGIEPNSVTLAAAAFVVAFGGFSVHAQSFHFIAGTGIKARPYLLAKALHGVIAAALTAIVWNLI